MTPDAPLSRGFKRVMVDNGAWGCFQRKVPWREDRFVSLVERHLDNAAFVVAPDIVCGGKASLDLSLAWVPALLARNLRVVIPVQNGMTPGDLAPHLGQRVGLFVGGDTEWKESTLPLWGELKTRTGCWLHVGRVNTARRIRLCAMSGVDSIDGTSASRFAKTVAPLDAALRQSALCLWG